MNGLEDETMKLLHAYRISELSTLVQDIQISDIFELSRADLTDIYGTLKGSVATIISYLC